MVYIVLPPELSKRSIQILIQYMYSGEATVSNDILNEVLHGGELLKIRGLWRNKTPSNESNNSTQYMPSAEAAKSTKGIDNDGCLYGDKPMSYEHPVHERNANNLSIIKESPVIVTSPTHLSAAAPHHRHQASPPQPPDFLLKDRRKFCCVTNPPDDKDCSDMSHPKPSSHNEMISSHLHPPPPPPLPPPPPPSLSVAPPQTIQLAQSHSTHELQQQQHNSSIIVKKELAIIANDNMAISSNIPASHYGLVSLQLAAAAVKKAQSPPILKPRNKTSVLLKQRNKTDSFIEKTQCGYQPPDAINENGNAQYEQQISRRYSDDSYLYGRDANDVPSGSHHHHHHHRGTHEVDHTIRHADKSRSIAHLKQQRPMTQHSIETMVEINVPVRKTSMNEQPPTPNPTPDTIRMMSIKQEPVEWTEFEHDNNLMEKSNIEVNVKPELVYSKDGSDGEGMSTHQFKSPKPFFPFFSLSVETIFDFPFCADAEMQEPIYSPLTCELCSETFTIPADWVRHIESHSEPATHCVPKKRKRIEVTDAGPHSRLLPFSELLKIQLNLFYRNCAGKSLGKYGRPAM